jgi:cysteine synthase
MLDTGGGPLPSDGRVRRLNDIRELIGNGDNPTPLVRLNRVAPEGAGPLYLKLEWYNPFGSIKDRTALYLLRGMAERGELDGREIVEPTSGNTGLALAALAAVMGLPITITIPEDVSEEKRVLLRMLGAHVRAAPDDMGPPDHPRDSAIALAHSLAESEATRDRYVMPNQYDNPDNIRAHYETTGPEVWAQTEGRVRCFLAGYGTCGTVTGVARYLKEREPGVRVIAIEPRPGHRIPGLKNLSESKPPAILDRSLIDEVIRVDDEAAYATAKRLFREEGLIVGPSTGAIAYAALTLERGPDELAVAISPDSGLKYASSFAEVVDDDGTPA